MKTMKVKCPHCSAIRTISDDWMSKQGKCPSCQQVFTLTPYAPDLQWETEDKTLLPPPQESLPGTTIAKVWQFIGGAGLLIACLSAIFGFVDVAKDNVPFSFLMLIVPISIAAWSLWPFSIAAVIKAINANTRMVEKLYWRQASQEIC